MLFPLPMTTRIAGYVARKRLAQRREVPDGPDARAAARLQPDLHRLRPHPRIRIDDQAEAHHRRVPGRGGRVRCAGRLDLRRRADDLPGDRRARRQDPGAEEGRHPLHARDVHPQEDRRLQAEPDLLLQRPPRRDAEEPRPGRRAGGRLRSGDRRHQGGQGGAVSSSAPTPRSTRKPTWRRSTHSSPT